MTRRGRQLLWLLIGVGLIGRVVLAFATVGVGFDIESLRLVGAALGGEPFETYSAVNDPLDSLGGFEVSRWPYPPGLFPWVSASAAIENATALPFHGLIQMAPIAADAAIGWLVQDFLGRRGASERTRLASAALVLIGPSFWIISGYHGQIDSVAILPAVAALAVWDRAPASHRAPIAGLLIGLGAAVKTVPIFMLLALLPSVRSFREGLWLVGAAAMLPLAAMAPFLIADFDAVTRALRYTGAPGLGGLTMLMQPELSTANLTLDFEGIEVGAVVRGIHARSGAIVLAGLAAVSALLFRFRPAPVHAATAIWLAVYVVSPAFFFQYVVWGVPFFLMAGYVREVALLQLLLLPGTVVFYLRPWSDDRIGLVYVPAMAVVWLALVLGVLLQLRQVVRAPARVRA